MNSNLLFFTLGFLIDKISIFPFALGFVASTILFNKNENLIYIYEKVQNTYCKKVKEEVKNKLNEFNKNEKLEKKNNKKQKK